MSIRSCDAVPHHPELDKEEEFLVGWKGDYALTWQLSHKRAAHNYLWSIYKKGSDSCRHTYPQLWLPVIPRIFKMLSMLPYIVAIFRCCCCAPKYGGAIVQVEPYRTKIEVHGQSVQPLYLICSLSYK